MTRADEFRKAGSWGRCDSVPEVVVAYHLPWWLREVSMVEFQAGQHFTRM